MMHRSHFIKSLIFTGLVLSVNFNLLRAQNESTQKTSVKNFTLIYDVERQPSANDSALLTRFTRELIDNFPVVANMKMYKWQSEKKWDKKTDKDILSGMSLEAFIRLNYSVNSDEITSVSPTLVTKNRINGLVNKIELPEYPANYYKDYDFNRFIANELSGFLNSFFNLNDGDKGAFKPPSYKWTALFPMAKDASTQDDYAKSNYFLDLVLGKNTDLSEAEKAQAYNLLGENKLNQYRIEEAEEEFNKALAIDSRNYDANFGIAKVRVEQDNFSGALMKASSLTPVTMEVFLLKGQAYMGLGQFEEAERNFGKITARSNPETYKKKLLFLGSIYLETDENDKAFEIYKALYAMDTTNADVGYLYGYLVSRKGYNEFNDKQYDSAVNLLRMADRIYKTADVTDYLRLALINDRRFDEALDLIERKIETGEYSVHDIYLTHALDIREIFIDTVQSENRNVSDFGEQVLRAIDLHLKYNPDDPVAYFYKGNTLTRMGRGDEGLVQMENAYSKNKQDPGVQLDLMELYLLNNKLAACENFYNRVVQDYKNRKTKIKDREEALMYYLLITSLELQNKDSKKPQKKLKRLLKSGVVVDRWSYGSYLAWLEKSNYDESAKSFLKDLTQQMKAHNKPG